MTINIEQNIDIEKEYLEKRLNDQINWYDNKSKLYKRLYHTFQIIKIVFAALITLLSIINENNWVSFIIALLGSFIIVFESINQLYKYHEKWIQYRTTCEQLKYHKYLYETRSYLYAEKENIFTKFVYNIEYIVSSENNQWKELYNKNNKGDE